MAESKNNIVTYGLSGKIGDLLVFRQKGNKTVVSKAPKEFTGDPSDEQLAVRSTFQKAVIYAKAALADAAIKAEYKEAGKAGGLTAYNVAIADFFKAPDIHEVDVTEYTGVPGNKIKIIVTDNFRVTNVQVKIENADGSLVEKGNAEQNGPDSPDWTYTATAANASLSGDKITITATDQPANASIKENSL